MAHIVRILTGLLALSAVGACGVAPVVNVERKETVHAVTATHRLIRFNAGQPQTVLSSRALVGLPAGDEIVGIDYRVARGTLFALARSGTLYTINAASGQLTRVSTVPAAVALDGVAFGVDFNPTADRLRVVSDRGQNMRLHPDSGAVVDGDANAPGVQPDAPLRYAVGDANAGRTPRVAAAAYTYNKRDDKLTTNFAIDAAQGTLVTQGSREGAVPVVSPNSGQLSTVGALGIGAFDQASFDIADVGGAAFMSVTRGAAASSQWYLVDLGTGRARLLGVIGGGEAIRSFAIEP